MAKAFKPAVAYLRPSSAANVGADKDSDKRQRAAIEAFARGSGFTILAEYYDAAVSGADHIDQRPGFVQMLQRLASNGARAIIVESPDRFARDLAVQLAGHGMLKSLGMSIIPASAPDFFTEDTPTAVLVRQVLGAISQFEKAGVVAKLAAARKRKRECEGRCEGRKPLSITRPEVVALARKLRRRKPKGGQHSLRVVASELAGRGFLNERGKPYAAKTVASMLCQNCC
ncbi:MAG: recombinase family protein [Methyloceanibacter sp.]|uniref:recombinase family protein n=1 Tax=Methyloceanibacter sp. TaxID=1965321 RepID=UPI003D9AE0B3